MPYLIKETSETRQMKRDAGVAFLTGGIGASTGAAILTWEILSNTPAEKMPLALAPALLGLGYMIYARRKLDSAVIKEIKLMVKKRGGTLL